MIESTSKVRHHPLAITIYGHVLMVTDSGKIER